MVSKSPESAQGIGLVILFPLAIVSNALVPTEHMPSLLWSLALVVVFAPLASTLYRRRTTD